MSSNSAGTSSASHDAGLPNDPTHREDTVHPGRSSTQSLWSPKPESPPIRGGCDQSVWFDTSVSSPQKLAKRERTNRQRIGLGIALVAVTATLAACRASADELDSNWPDADSITPAEGHSKYHLAQELGDETTVYFPGIGRGTLTLSISSIQHASRCDDQLGNIVEGDFIVATMNVHAEGLPEFDTPPLSSDNWSIAADRGRERHTINNPCAGNERLLNITGSGTRDITAHFTIPPHAETLRLNVTLKNGEVRGWEWDIPR